MTPLVEGYGGWAFRMEIVPIESAYPGFGDIVVSLMLVKVRLFGKKFIMFAFV